MSDVMTSILTGATRDAAAVENLAAKSAVELGPWGSLAA